MGAAGFFLLGLFFASLSTLAQLYTGSVTGVVTDPDGPPVGTIVPEKKDRTFLLPKASITVLRGEIDGAGH